MPRQEAEVAEARPRQEFDAGAGPRRGPEVAARGSYAPSRTPYESEDWEPRPVQDSYVRAPSQEQASAPAAQQRQGREADAVQPQAATLSTEDPALPKNFEWWVDGLVDDASKDALGSAIIDKVPVTLAPTAAPSAGRSESASSAQGDDVPQRWDQWFNSYWKEIPKSDYKPSQRASYVLADPLQGPGWGSEQPPRPVSVEEQRQPEAAEQEAQQRAAAAEQQRQQQQAEEAEREEQRRAEAEREEQLRAQEAEREEQRRAQRAEREEQLRAQKAEREKQLRAREAEHEEQLRAQEAELEEQRREQLAAEQEQRAQEQAPAAAEPDPESSVLVGFPQDWLANLVDVEQFAAGADVSFYSARLRADPSRELVVKRATPRDAGTMARVLSEARFMQQVRWRPSFLTCYQIDPVSEENVALGKDVFFMLEPIAGNLEELVLRKSLADVPLTTRVRLFADLVRAALDMEYFGIVHSDLNSRNVLIVGDVTNPRGYHAVVSNFANAVLSDSDADSAGRDVMALGQIADRLLVVPGTQDQVPSPDMTEEAAQRALTVQRTLFEQNSNLDVAQLVARMFDPDPATRATAGEALYVLVEQAKRLDIDLRPREVNEDLSAFGAQPRRATAERRPGAFSSEALSWR
eukprot:CAMPEP_0170253732 /NCGR_PEP_ID=MMETSP0116_2-20130129/26710_1 /TAXON_ID=400756 /ORGANISM="Durinskia baltica, Strain CSIRO CS-38" /LENGTH=635 /DNA_ID=CAMNT_0010504723 /DNA_START=21 /DNA_END=1925 /DNA_ORIENTATION=+